MSAVGSWQEDIPGDGVAAMVVAAVRARSFKTSPEVQSPVWPPQARRAPFSRDGARGTAPSPEVPRGGVVTGVSSFLEAKSWRILVFGSLIKTSLYFWRFFIVDSQIIAKLR
jgi:hypothetical protein